MIKRLAILLILILVLTGQTYAGTTTTNGFFYKPSLGATGATEKTNFDSGMDRVDTRLGKEIWVGDPNYGTTIQAAVTAIGVNSVILRIPAGSYSITADLTIPANITLKPERGAILAIATTKTLTINGGFEAGLYQVFSCTGTGKVVFGVGLINSVNVAWFGWTTGTNTAPVRAANLAVLNLAIGSLYNGTSYTGTIEIPTGIGYCDTELVMPTGTAGVTFKGQVPVTSQIVDGGVPALNSCSRIGFIGSGTGIHTASASIDGVSFVNIIVGYGGYETESVGTVPDYILKIGNSGRIADSMIHGAKIAVITDGYFIVNYVMDRVIIGYTDAFTSKGAGLLLSNYHNTTMSFNSCYIKKSNRGVDIRTLEGSNFNNSIFESNVSEGIYLYQSNAAVAIGPLRNINFNGCYVENNWVGLAAGAEYQIVVTAQTPASYQPDSIKFDGCHFTGVDSANRRMLNLNAALRPTFKNCGAFAYYGNAAVINNEVLIGTYCIGAIFDNCESVNSTRTYISGSYGKAIAITSENNNGIKISEFDPQTVGAKSNVLNFYIENPAAAQTDQPCNAATDLITGITSYLIPFKGVPTSINITGNAAIGVGTITFKLQYYNGAAWVDTALSKALTVGDIRGYATNFQNFYYAITAGSQVRVVYTTTADYSATTIDWFVVVGFAM